MITYFPLNKIKHRYSVNDWINWLEEEKKMIRRRFGNDVEALKYWPNDYYDKMEKWWASDNRILEPIELCKCGYIEDGSHRVAISYKIGLKSVPVVFVECCQCKQ